MDGLLVVDKPAGPTSHDVVARMRRVLDERRIGHTGTLDPAATGVLALVLGRATRLAQFLTDSSKSYEAVVRLGVATDTGDAQGRAIGPVGSRPVPSRDAIEEALRGFRGTFLQQPPAFSAKKIGGKRSHDLARAGVASVLPAPVSVTVHRLDIVGADGDCVTLNLECSAGFYVRALAADLGERLGVGAHLVALRRTRAGDCTLQHAIALDTAEREPGRAAAAVVPMAEMLPRLPVVLLTSDGVRRARNGCDLEPPAAGPESALARLVDPDGRLVGIGRYVAARRVLHPSVIVM